MFMLKTFTKHPVALLGILVVLILLARPSTSWSADVNGRKGFFAGIDIGGGGISNSDIGTDGALLGTVKAGLGISENLLLMGELAGALRLKSVSANTSGLWGLYGSAQVFLVDHFYVRPGVGFAHQSLSDVSLGDNSEFGFSMTAAAGYEFRLRKSLALSPEARLLYARMSQQNVTVFGADLDLRWYF